MNRADGNDNKPQPQTATNSEGKPIANPFENIQTAERDITQAVDKLQKEQEFKEAQTERD